MISTQCQKYEVLHSQEWEWMNVILLSQIIASVWERVFIKKCLMSWLLMRITEALWECSEAKHSWERQILSNTDMSRTAESWRWDELQHADGLWAERVQNQSEGYFLNWRLIWLIQIQSSTYRNKVNKSRCIAQDAYHLVLNTTSSMEKKAY